MNETTPADARRLISNLEYMVKAYEEQWQRAQAAVAEAEKHRDEWKKRLASAKDLLEFEKTRLGKQLSLEERGPYAGLALREAALRVVQDRGGKPVTAAEIVETLSSYGYAMNTRYPGRALHTALMHVKDVEKVAASTYRWRGGDQ